MVSDIVKSVSPSATIKLLYKETELKSKGEKIISFSLGEPDFSTPEEVLNFACKKMYEGKTHYTPSSGIIELRNRIAEKYKKENKVNVEEKNVIVTPTKFGIYMSYLTLLNPGDEILIPDPGWVSYVEMAHLVGAKPVFYKLNEEDNFQIDEEDMKKKITDKTRVILINTPSNPTGSILNKNSLKIVGDLANEKNLFIISDEIYEKIIFEGEHISIASMDNLFERTVTVNGFSKSHAMTGLRIGYVIADESLIKYMDNVQQHTLTCAPSFSQYAALKALDDEVDSKKMVEEFRKRREVIYSGLSKIPYFNVKKPEATFYIFPRFDYGGLNSMDMATFLLEKLKISVVPGIAFGPSGENHLRFSFSTSMENIEEGIKRLGGLGNL
ncbi:MAG: pyridoxal phosphate-dependent aminotransferase [Thermoplasmata archaeon]